MNETTISSDRPAKTTQSGSGRGVRLLVLLAALLLPAQTVPAAGADLLTDPFVMGTNLEASSLLGKWYRRIYGEAFRRLGIPLSFMDAPTARLSILADEGAVQGQIARLPAYADAHPNQVRVAEVIQETRLALHGYDPAAKNNYPKSIEGLATGKWLVDYRRGVEICEKSLNPTLSAANLSDVTSAAQGMQKLMAGRTHLYCEFDVVIQAELLTPEFKGVSSFRPVLDMGVTMQLYPYVHKSRADLAAKLAETLKKMKAEGLLESYFREAQRELEAAR